MTWPTAPVTTTNLDSSTDSPASARADLLDMAQKVNLMIANGAPTSGGLLLGVQRITSSGAYTPTAGATSAIIEIQAAGGGGGGAGSTTSGTRNLGSGGAGGAYVRLRIASLSAAGAISLAVGALGSGGSTGGGDGNDGGAASVTLSTGGGVTCAGGTGGQGQATSPANTTFDSHGSVYGGAVTKTSGAYVVLEEIPGQDGLRAVSMGSTSSQTGAGGSSIKGMGASGLNATTGFGDGNTAAGYGAGGSGAQSNNGLGARGGAGSGGLILVWEYA